MKYSLLSASTSTKATDCLVLGVWTKNKLTAQAAAVDKLLNGEINRIVGSGDVTGKIGDSLFMHPMTGNAKRILLVGCGDEGALDARNYRKVINATIKAILKSTAKDAVLALAELPLKDRDPAWAITLLVQECDNCTYQYDHTKSKKKPAHALKAIAITTPADANRKAMTEALKAGESIAVGVSAAKELGNLPGNICTPTYLADTAVKLAGQYKSLTTKVLNEKQMEKLGMGSLLSVSAGSKEEAKLIVIEYKGAVKTESKPYVLVGKGITFDTGGISLKPGLGMDEMKYDMCGAASVIGTMTAVAELGLAINVIGVIAAAENMPSGKATKPGDIVTSMSGQTIEILNTDAEGRLVLCDALTYVERFKPKTVIDIATLTGAAVATFGDQTSALLSSHQPLADELLGISQQTLDFVWQLPLWEEYQSLLDSNFADIANIGGPRAGTITAACFLSRFTKKYHWAHLDIAGTAWLSGAQKGATGRPVPLLVEYLRRQKA
ncbi:MAG: leucyl aminopeptidase [Gammaproteobacteria bacterium]|nr:leucyl aminopeptidase [Gammaproteobacteria bacterium]MDP2140666.1 leucyl aminopeptidase [Gammaproteobacteria bacterium]MDP2346925.1 leucyl aminopeptidase [Gammaproteobacteria bacterium]